jgi:hypothetical protein
MVVAGKAVVDGTALEGVGRRGREGSRTFQGGGADHTEHPDEEYSRAQVEVAGNSPGGAGEAGPRTENTADSLERVKGRSRSRESCSPDYTFTGCR